MTTDQNKHIAQIKYKHLNLATQINFDDGRNIAYTYDAAGSISKQVDIIIINRNVNRVKQK
jgi:YD repeat-containing protein